MLFIGSNGLERLIDHYQKSIISGSAFYQGINKPADKNSTGQHCGTDHDAEDGHPNDSRDVHRGHVTAQRRQPPNFAIVTLRYRGGNLMREKYAPKSPMFGLNTRFSTLKPLNL